MGRRPLPDRSCRPLTIKEALTLKGILTRENKTTRELAFELDIAQQYVYLKLKGKRGLTKEEARKIFEYLGRNPKI